MTSARLATLLVAVVVACLASSSLLAFSGRVAPWEEVADAEGPPRRLAEAVVRSEGYAATMTMARDMADEVFGDANGPQSRALSIARPVREDAAARAVRHLYQQMLGSGLGGRVRDFVIEYQRSTRTEVTRCDVRVSSGVSSERLSCGSLGERIVFLDAPPSARLLGP